MAPKLRFETDFFPVVTVVFAAEGCSDEDVEHLIAGFRSLLTRRQIYSAIVDGGGITAIPNARQRARLAEFEQGNVEAIRRYNVGSALVIDSAIGRGAITAMRWISKPTAPEAVFSNPGDAGKWCIGRLEEKRVAIPFATREYVEALAQGGPRALRSSVIPRPGKGKERSSAG